MHLTRAICHPELDSGSHKTIKMTQLLGDAETCEMLSRLSRDQHDGQHMRSQVQYVTNVFRFEINTHHTKLASG